MAGWLWQCSNSHGDPFNSNTHFYNTTTDSHTFPNDNVNTNRLFDTSIAADFG
jgi:hypothetical protein